MPNVLSPASSVFGPVRVTAGSQLKSSTQVAPTSATLDPVDTHAGHTPINGDIPSHVPLPWQIPELPKSKSLHQQQHELKAPERQAILNDFLKQLPQIGVAVNRSLPFPDSEDTRSPHRIVQTAMALAFKDKQISVSEASEIRGLMLGLLPASERNKYKAALAAMPLSEAVKPILRQIDPDLSVYTPGFNSFEVALIDSTSFKIVFPNFQCLTLPQQRQVITELSVYLNHFPELLPTLASVRNDNYGPGFQYFFLNPEQNNEFDKVIPKGVVGVIMPGSSVVKDPLLGLLAQKISLKQLDRGGMFINTLQHGVFSHEFAHVIHLHQLNDDQRDQIKNLFDKAWNTMRQSQGQQGFVSDYAKTNPYEYFAEGMEFYLVNGPEKLKQRDPKLHQFISDLMAPGHKHSASDGTIFSDPERVHVLVSQQGPHTLFGASVSRESDLVSLRHFEGGITQELAVLGNQAGAIARASVGLKAAWKPWDKPASIYATAGASVQAGYLQGASVGAGGYAGVGIDYKHFNAEIRHNAMAGHNVQGGTEARIGLRFEF